MFFSGVLLFKIHITLTYIHYLQPAITFNSILKLRSRNCTQREIKSRNEEIKRIVKIYIHKETPIYNVYIRLFNSDLKVDNELAFLSPGSRLLKLMEA